MTRSGILAASFLAFVGSAASQGAEPLANAGKLTCTIEPTASSGAETHDLSCRFEPIGGVERNYQGSLKWGQKEPPNNRSIVMVWTVLAPETEVPAGSLAGKYRTGLSDEPGMSAMKAGALRRDSAYPIELRALTSVGAGANNGDMSAVIELELRGVKV